MRAGPVQLWPVKWGVASISQELRGLAGRSEVEGLWLGLAGALASDAPHPLREPLAVGQFLRAQRLCLLFTT